MTCILRQSSVIISHVFQIIKKPAFSAAHYDHVHNAENNYIEVAQEPRKRLQRFPATNLLTPNIRP